MSEHNEQCGSCGKRLEPDRDAICHDCSPDSEFEAQMDAAEVMSDRIAALRAKAERVGLTFSLGRSDVITYGDIHFWDEHGDWVASFTEEHLDTAATLLGALDKDAVVVNIRQLDDDANNEKICDNFCALVPSRCSMSNASFNLRGERSPNELCPGPCDDDHEWVLVQRKVAK